MVAGLIHLARLPRGAVREARHEGALACLEYFGVPDAQQRESEYAERKQAMLLRLIEEARFDAYADGVRLVMAVRAAGIPVAAASSSKNAHRFLRAIRLGEFGGGDTSLLDVFDADLSGRDFTRGKPDPEIFSHRGRRTRCGSGTVRGGRGRSQRRSGR